MTKYIVFRRTCNNWEQFAKARKFRVAVALSYEEARAICDQYNNNRNSSQIKRGCKYEFTAMENWA